MFSALLDLVLPRTCAGCGTSLLGRAHACVACLAALDAPVVRAVPRPCPPGLPPTWTAAAYEPPVRDLVLAHKERGRLGLSAPLAAALARAALRVRADALVWVPSSRRAIRARGYDHARRLAVRAARHLGIPAVPVLHLVRRVADQSGLSAEARAANVHGAFAADPACVPGLLAHRLVVVDDVMTTGWTLDEAARALRAAGLDVAGAAVVAAGLDRPAPTPSPRAPSRATPRAAARPIPRAAAHPIPRAAATASPDAARRSRATGHPLAPDRVARPPPCAPRTAPAHPHGHGRPTHAGRAVRVNAVKAVRA